LTYSYNYATLLPDYKRWSSDSHAALQSSGSGFKSLTWMKFDLRFQPCMPQASSVIMSTLTAHSLGRRAGKCEDWPNHTM